MEQHNSETQIRQLMCSGEIRLAGYHLNKYPNTNLLKIWKALLEHNYQKMHEFLQMEETDFQLDLMKYVANMLCDLAIALSVKEVDYYLGPYKHQILAMYKWKLENNFYILRALDKPVLSVNQLKDISIALTTAKK